MIFVNTQVEQQKIAELLSEHVNHVIQEIFEKKMKGMAYDEIREVYPMDAVFCKKIRNYLPKSYPVNLAGEAFLGAYYMLKSYSIYMPDPITAYVINSVLRKEIDLRKAVGISLIEHTFSCDGLIDELTEIVVQSQEEADLALKDIIFLRGQRSLCEDISKYPALCDISEDYERLDILSENGLKHLIKEKDKLVVYTERTTL